MSEIITLGPGEKDPYKLVFAIRQMAERVAWLNQAVMTTSSPTFAALTLTSGQIVFPATQVPSAGVNTLDDYEEGTFVPTFTFQTPGDLNVVYSTQTGAYTKIGRLVTVHFNISLSTFTHTTAAGFAVIGALPFTAANISGQRYLGETSWQGITKALYTQVNPLVSPATSSILLVTFGSGVNADIIDTADMPTGGLPEFVGSVSYVTT